MYNNIWNIVHVDENMLSYIERRNISKEYLAFCNLHQPDVQYQALYVCYISHLTITCSNALFAGRSKQ
jgi:hypothetical protein